MRIGDTLLVGQIDVNSTWREISGWSAGSMPTLINCERYKQLIWMGVKSSDAPIQYVLRLGDQTGWQQTLTGVLTGDANNWFQVEITLPRLWSWYRIEVASSVSQQLRCKISGVRG
jgi:hypothetical protein